MSRYVRKRAFGHVGPAKIQINLACAFAQSEFRIFTGSILNSQGYKVSSCEQRKADQNVWMCKMSLVSAGCTWQNVLWGEYVCFFCLFFFFFFWRNYLNIQLCVAETVSWLRARFGAIIIRPGDYKTFFMLNLAWWIFPANKYGNANNSWHFHIYLQRNLYALLCLAIKNLQLSVIWDLWAGHLLTGFSGSA